MRDDEIRGAMELVEISKTEIEQHPVFAALSSVSEEQTWLANFASKNTRDTYRRAIGSFMATVGVTTPDELHRVKPAHVIAWRTAMEAAGMSQPSIKARLAALSSLFKHLTDCQLMPANPAAGIRRPSTGPKGTGSGKSPTIPIQIVRAMLDAPNTDTLQGLRDRAILHVLFYCGSRCSEPTLLKVRDFHRDNEYQILNTTIKGNKRNPIPLDPECIEAIRQYLDQASHAADPDAYIFQAIKNRKSGKALSRQRLYFIFEKYARKAGVAEHIFPHCARATFITEAARNGTPLPHIQRTVGHSSITTTEAYIHAEKKYRESASLRVRY